MDLKTFVIGVNIAAVDRFLKTASSLIKVQKQFTVLREKKV